VAEEGDLCGSAGALACSADGKALLRCDGWKMDATQTCRGERGCFRETPDAEPTCDRGPAEVGDVCEGSMGSRCAVDGKTILQCDPLTHHFVLERNCRGAKGCFDFSAEASPEYLKRVGGDRPGFRYLACDVSVGDVGEPCWGYAGVGALASGSRVFCSSDGKQELTCRDGLLLSRGSCTCTATWVPKYGSWNIGCGPDAWSPPFLSLAERP